MINFWVNMIIRVNMANYQGKCDNLSKHDKLLG